MDEIIFLSDSGAKLPSTEKQNLEQTYQLLVESIDEYAIFFLDPDGFIRTWNAGGERLKGYKPHEVIGSHFSRFYQKVDIDRCHPQAELQIAATKGKYEEEGWRVRKDGSVFWANVVITALRNDKGELYGFGKVTRDLSQKRKAELALRESEERFRLLVSNVTEYALITLDPNGRVTSWNVGAERIKGYRPKEILGKHFSVFYPRSEVDNGKPEMELRIAINEGRYEEEGWRVRKDGTMFWANVIVTPIRDENHILRGFAKVTRDLTSRRQVEEALRESQEKYRSLLDNITDYAVILLDSKGRITSWNAGACRITGFEKKEILGSSISVFYGSEDVQNEKHEEQLRLAFEDGRCEEEGLRIRKDGRSYWAKVVITPIKDESGNLRGYSNVMADVTERKQAEDLLKESEERFRLMVESVQDYAIFMLDPKGSVSTWNRGAERTKGYSADEIIGQHFSKFYPPEDNQAGKPDWELRTAIQNGRFEDEGWRLRRDGSRFWANVIITPVYGPSQELVGFAKVTRDLTERKKAEDILKAAYEDLELKVRERTRELSEAKARAEAAVEARDVFFSMASHELKTPLSALKLQSQIRLRRAQKGDFSPYSPDQIISTLQDDERQIRKLSVLVDKMLDITQLGSDRFHLTCEEFELTRFLKEVSERLLPIMEESKNELDLQVSEEIIGIWDRLRMEQVLTNILVNACKYAPGTRISVSALRDNETVRIEVRDRGPGISKSDQDKIFEPFHRAANSSKQQGLGLGLFLCRKIIDAHGGQLTVQSEPGEGTAFLIELPLSKWEQAGRC